MRYFIYLSYNGTAYHGWQIQPNGISVQEVLTKVFSTMLREDTEITGAGRTDAGVHAKLMVAHFDTADLQVTSDEFVRKLNSFLPKDIAVSKIVPVKPDAHARFDAVLRTYEYRITQEKDVFLENLAVRMFHPLNFELMNQAATCLKNYRDFTSFSKLHTDVKTNNCVIHEAKWEQSGSEWIFTISADRFLRNMVRSIVGTLIDVGVGKLDVPGFCKIIEAQNRCKAGASMPAHGLYLTDVQYPSELFL